MIDVFVATIADEPIRQLLCRAVQHRWQCDPLARMSTFVDSTNDGELFSEMGKIAEFIPRDRMQRERRIKADELAQSDIYIVADDDCMPIGPNFIERGLKVMEAHPEHGILAAMNWVNKNDTVPYTGTFIDDDVWECHAVGGIRFCRKGIIKQWPESVDSGSYDCQHHEALVNAGYKAGYIRTVQMGHLGYGLSQHWPAIPEIELYKEKVCS